MDQSVFQPYGFNRGKTSKQLVNNRPSHSVIFTSEKPFYDNSIASKKK